MFLNIPLSLLLLLEIFLWQPASCFSYVVQQGNVEHLVHLYGKTYDASDVCLHDNKQSTNHSYCTQHTSNEYLYKLYLLEYYNIKISNYDSQKTYQILAVDDKCHT